MRIVKSKRLDDIQKEIKKLEEPIDDLRKERNKIQAKLYERNKIQEKFHENEKKQMVGNYYQRKNFFFHPIEIKEGVFYGSEVFRDNQEPQISYKYGGSLIGWREITKEKFYGEVNKVLIKCNLFKVK